MKRDNVMETATMAAATGTVTPRNAKTAYEDVLRGAEEIKNGDPITIATMSPGDSVRQGDIYVICLDVDPERASEFVGRQLAPGVTQGSRHIVEGECELFTPDPTSATEIINRLVPSTKNVPQLFGPVIRTTGTVEVTHPEHANVTLPCDGSYLVTYQRAHADELRRQED